MGAELQGLQAGEERSGSIASQAVECCLETMVEQLIAVRTDQARSTFDDLCEFFFRRFETSSPPARRCQEKKKEEETVKLNMSKAEPVSSWCYQRQAGSTKMHQRSSLELDLPRVRCVPGESGSAGRASKQGDRKRGPSRSPDELLWMKKTMTMWEDWCLI